MNRFEAHENLAGAVKAAYAAGLEPWEVQQAIAFGSADAGKLDQAALAHKRADEAKSGVTDDDDVDLVQADPDDSIELCSECQGKLCADCLVVVS